MREGLSLPPKRQYQPFSEFLPVLFHSFAEAGIRICILRNYEGFPANNIGNDLDILICRRDLSRVIDVLRSLDNIRVINYTEMNVFISVYLEGAFATPGSRSIQVDFFWSMASKGPEYLSADVIFQVASQRQAGGLNFLVPSPAHEAIISLCANLVYGGFLKEKYFPKVQQTFISDRSEVIDALQSPFGMKAATRLVDAVTEGDRRRILGCIKPLRAALYLRCSLRKPFRGALDIARYYVSVFRLRYSPKNIETICILGPVGCGKTTIIDGLIPMLHSAAKVVEIHHFKAQLPLVRESFEICDSSDSHARAADSSLSSIIRTVQWLLVEWVNQLIRRRELTLRIVEYCGRDLIIDPVKFGYKGPAWLARILEKLFPPCDIWILLDSAVEGVQSKNREVLPAETLCQHEAYRSYVKTKNHHVILDASKLVANTTEETYAAIIEMLALRAGKKLNKCF
jgi:hypothetical protein